MTNILNGFVSNEVDLHSEWEQFQGELQSLQHADVLNRNKKFEAFLSEAQCLNSCPQIMSQPICFFLDGQFDPEGTAGGSADMPVGMNIIVESLIEEHIHESTAYELYNFFLPALEEKVGMYTGHIEIFSGYQILEEMSMILEEYEYMFSENFDRAVFDYESFDYQVDRILFLLSQIFSQRFILGTTLDYLDDLQKNILTVFARSSAGEAFWSDYVMPFFAEYISGQAVLTDVAGEYDEVSYQCIDDCADTDVPYEESIEDLPIEYSSPVAMPNLVEMCSYLHVPLTQKLY